MLLVMLNMFMFFRVSPVHIVYSVQVTIYVVLSFSARGQQTFILFLFSHAHRYEMGHVLAPSREGVM